MERKPRTGPHPVRESPVFRHARNALTALVADLMDASPAFLSLYLLAMEELDRDFDTPFTASMADAEAQAGLDQLRAGLKHGGVSAFDRLLEQMHRLRPAEASMFQSLAQVVTELLLIHLGRLPLTPGWLEVERLSPDSGVRILAHGEGGAAIWVPYDVEERHLMDLRTYLRLRRPAGHPGRPPKPPEAPRTPRRRSRLSGPLADLAAKLDQEELHWTAIAQALWPGVPLPTEAKAREALRQRVKRLIVRGRLDALR
jgi:hypothetical protein